MIQKIIDIMWQHAKKWHQENRTFFELNARTECVEDIAVELLYHNYLIWHYIDLYKSDDKSEVLFVYDKGIEHNRYRNEAIEKIDQIVCANQLGTGKINSETIGSIFDRISILQIKILHLIDNKDQRVVDIVSQMNILANCAKELYQDMINGERQCIVFNRFKINYSEQA